MTESTYRYNQEAYRRLKERARARSAALTLAGQDIGTLPPVRDPVRRARADREFRFFCEAYFAHVFWRPWSKDHLRVIEKIERVVEDYETFAVAMPRGSGKTSLCLAAVLWATLAGKHAFVYLIGATEQAAQRLLENLKAHLRRNDLLLADYPEVVYPIRCLEGESKRATGQRYCGVPTGIVWGKKEIVYPTIPGSRGAGAVIRVAGLAGHIRGDVVVRRDGSQVRPTLAICDDPQTDESAHSAIQTAERLSIIRGAVANLAGPGERTAIIVPCTVICEGDLADQLLDRERNPAFQGERTKMVYAFPTNERLWQRYRDIRAEAFQRGDRTHPDTAFYLRHREEMDAGAVVAWPERYDPKRGEVSAIQHAMNIRFDLGDAAFFAEFQNEPLPEGAQGADRLTAEQVRAKASGRPRGAVPVECTVVTAFVDVHDRVLYWMVCGWREDFTGHVIDYGTHPKQPAGVFFTQATAPASLAREYPGAGRDGAILAGLEAVVRWLLQRTFPRGEGVVRVDRLLVDAGYKPALVEAVKFKVGGATMMPYRGVGIRAANRPMSSYRRRPGERHGHHWYVPNVRKTGEFPHVLADVNYWKTFVHDGLLTRAGEAGALSLFGRPGDHDMLACHIAESETWTETQGHGRTVREWSPLPSRPDNHWFDCLVGCAVAASMCGCAPAGVEPARPRRRWTREHFRKRARV